MKVRDSESTGKESRKYAGELTDIQRQLTMDDQMNIHLENEMNRIKRRNIRTENECTRFERLCQEADNMVDHFKNRSIRYETKNRNLHMLLRQGNRSLNIRDCSGTDGNHQEYRLWRQDQSNDIRRNEKK